MARVDMKVRINTKPAMWRLSVAKPFLLVAAALEGATLLPDGTTDRLVDKCIQWVAGHIKHEVVN